MRAKHACNSYKCITRRIVIGTRHHYACWAWSYTNFVHSAQNALYCMIEWLLDNQLHWIVDFIQHVTAGVPLRTLVHGDFYALPAKMPHGPIVNERPFVNFTTMWKLIGAHIADQYVPLLARAGVLPCTQLALHASSSVADLLRVLHNYIWFSLFRRCHVCMIVDNVRHVYGQVVHDTL